MAAIDFRAELERLALGAYALAAVGAALRLRREGVEAPHDVNVLLNEVVGRVGVSPLDDLMPGDIDRLYAVANFHLRHAMELFAHPARPATWNHGDPELLEAQGIMSRAVVPKIVEIAASRPSLAAAIADGGSFLDVGTGVGWIAIEAARAWPRMRIHGIDILEAALSRAKLNVAKEGVASQVTLRAQDVLQLPERGAFSLVWLPTPFFTEDAFAAAARQVHEALVPGGSVVCGLEALPADPLARALSVLRTIRGGGRMTTADEIAACLHAARFVDVEVFPSGPLILIVGRKMP